jgi:ribosomal subunit interface protein
MSFSNIQYKATNIYIERTWKDLIEQKFRTLEKYLGANSPVSCHVEFEKIAAHQTGDVHRVEVNVSAHSKMFRAEATESSFEVAIDAVRKELDRELSKNHDRRDTLLKRGRRKIKEMLRFGR